MPEIPAEFICPITLQLMRDPVMTRSGQNFERKAILEWLVQHANTCPLTRQLLQPSNLVGNYNLKARIYAWCCVNDISLIGTDVDLEAMVKPEDVVPSIRVTKLLKHMTKLPSTTTKKSSRMTVRKNNVSDLFQQQPLQRMNGRSILTSC